MEKEIPVGIPVGFEVMKASAWKKHLTSDDDDVMIPRSDIFEHVTGTSVGCLGVLDVDANNNTIVTNQKNLVLVGATVYAVSRESLLVNESFLTADLPQRERAFALGDPVFVTIDDAVTKRGAISAFFLTTAPKMVFNGEVLPFKGFGLFVYCVVLDDGSGVVFVGDEALTPVETRYTKNDPCLMTKLENAFFEKAEVVVEYENPTTGSLETFTGVLSQYMCPSVGKSGNTLFEINCTLRNGKVFEESRKLWHCNVISLVVPNRLD